MKRKIQSVTANINGEYNLPDGVGAKELWIDLERIQSDRRGLVQIIPTIYYAVNVEEEAEEKPAKKK